MNLPDKMIIEDQSKVTLEMCELLAADGFRAVIKSGRVIYFTKEEQNNDKCE